jgi:predicted alpha/beta superfamily hydrolase
MTPAPAFTLTSPQTRTNYQVFVAPPAEIARAPGIAPPAVLFLDGDDQFRFALDAYRAGRAAGEIPPLLLAGLGYGASYTKPGNKRLRDYTPTAMATEPESGGADGFVAFLTRTLWPELARRYRVNGDVRGIAGHSLGSLLAVHALFQRAPFFNRVLASAPSLWWDNRAALCAAQNLQRTGTALPARLFLGVGEADTPSMTGDLELLEQQLAAQPFPQLEVISRRFPERDHYNVLPEAFRAGLVALFA